MKNTIYTALAAFLISTSMGHAQSDIFLLIDGIQGESVDPQHAGEIDVLTWSNNVTATAETTTGGGAKSGRLDFGDFQITKLIDTASLELYIRALTQVSIPHMTLTHLTPGTRPFEFLIIEMFDVKVVGISIGGSGVDDGATESVDFRPSVMEWNYIRQKTDGSEDTPVEFCYDLERNVEC